MVSRIVDPAGIISLYSRAAATFCTAVPTVAFSNTSPFGMVQSTSSGRLFVSVMAVVQLMLLRDAKFYRINLNSTRFHQFHDRFLRLIHFKMQCGGVAESEQSSRRLS